MGARLNRSLFHLRRDHLHICTVCDETHAKYKHNTDYRSVEDTSEPVTFDEPWQEMPNGVVFQATADFRLQMLPLSQHG